MRWVLPVLLAAVAACGTPRWTAPFGGQRPSTCYALEYGGGGASVFPLRIGIVGTRGRVIGVPSPEIQRAWGLFSYKGVTSPFPGDSSEVQFSRFWDFITLRLHAQGDSLSGVAWHTSDVLLDGPPPRTPVRGHRIACDSHERW
jgi:hypothetical protein